MANAHDSTSMEISPAAAAIIASTAKEVAEQQAMNEALEAQIQDGVQELLRIQSELRRIHNLRQVRVPPALHKRSRRDVLSQDVEEKLKSNQVTRDPSGDDDGLAESS